MTTRRIAITMAVVRTVLWLVALMIFGWMCGELLGVMGLLVTVPVGWMVGSLLGKQLVQDLSKHYDPTWRPHEARGDKRDDVGDSLAEESEDPPSET